MPKTSRAGRGKGAFPVGSRSSIAYAGPIDVASETPGCARRHHRKHTPGVFLSQLSGGKTGAAFILGRDGAVIAAPDPDADEVHMRRHDQPLLRVAQMALKETGAANANDKSHRRPVTAGEGYAVTLTALDFAGLDARHGHSRGGLFGPDRDHHPAPACRPGPLPRRRRDPSAWLARRVIAGLPTAVADELEHVQRSELDQVRVVSSRVAELADLLIRDFRHGRRARCSSAMWLEFGVARSPVR